MQFHQLDNYRFRCLMSIIFANRILETSTTTGTGPYTPAGLVTGYNTFASISATTLDTFDYYAEDVTSNGTPSGGWEAGTGTRNADGTISRVSVESSSNGNSAVNWGAGTRRLGLGLNATRLAAIAADDGLAYAILFGEA